VVKDLRCFKTCGCSSSCWGYTNFINAGQMTRDEALMLEEHAIAHYGEGLRDFLVDGVGLSGRQADRLIALEGVM
ncbi:MAG: hypothetical protein ACYTFO_08610, partial [Planctomycetota bacterium]|jgi:hypothetical protein